MSAATLSIADLVAVRVLVSALVLPRHRKPELVVAILTANVGVLAAAAALSRLDHRGRPGARRLPEGSAHGRASL